MYMQELADAFGAGVYLLFTVINFDLWLKRRDRASNLWLAAAGAGALAVNLTGIYLRRIGAAAGSTGILPTINLLGVVLVTLSLVELVLSLDNRKSGLAIRAVYAAMLALVLVIEIGGYLQLVALLLLTSLAFMILAMILAVKAGLEGDREARAVAGGLMVLVLALVADILGLVGVVPHLRGLPLVGFTVLFLVAASALNGRYAREHAELVALQHELELRVLDRTRELELANRRLEEASLTDALTGLPNRRGFEQVSEHALERAVRARQTFSIVMIDLDHFKEINDRHGHAAGDELLRAAATRLREVLRAQDVVARWGGEEFILLLPETGASAARGASEKARVAIADHPFEQNGTRETITASFGIAQHEFDQSLERTIARADAALYRAKAEGRNRVVQV